MSNPLPGGTITVLMTDIEGSTQHWAADGDAMAEAVGRHEAILAAAIEAHDGRRPLEQGEGDSMVAGFALATDAVAAVCDAQVALDGEPWPGGNPLRVRMSIHTGEVRVLDGDRYAGPVLNRAACLRSLAHGGQVLVSAVTRDLVVDSLPEGSAVIDRGWHVLRGLERPEHVYELRSPGLEREFPVLVSARSSNLPEEVTSFVGRADDVVELTNALGGTRILTLTGTGGCGKTRLAQRIATTVAPDYPGGAWWVELASLTDGTLLASTVASALGLADEPYRGPADLLVDQFAELPALLVLDNCEHLLDATSALVATLTAACPGLRVLVTSRESLNMPGEVAWRVPSLPDPDAVRLFVERAIEVRPNLSPSDDAEALARICSRLDGIPLAIELAAARSRMLSVAQIADALDDRFRLLTGGQRTVVQRQRTLSASIDWSHDLLDAHERAVLRRLSVFAGAFGLDAAEAVAAGDDVDSYAVLDLIGRLVDKSLLAVDETGGGVRYRMLESIRQYARDRLVDAAEVERAQGRHLEWYSSWIVTLGPELVTADHARRLDELEAERENIRVALQWADATGDGDRLRAMCVALTFFWMLHGHFREGSTWCERALAIDDGGADRAAVEWGLAYIALYGGYYETSFELAAAGYASAEAVGDRSTMARCLDTLATLQVFIDPTDAADTAATAVELARTSGDLWCLGDALQVMGTAIGLLDDHDRAAECFEEAFAIATAMDNRQLLAWHWVLAGNALIRMGQVAEAEPLLRLGISIAEEVGDLGIISHAVLLLGQLLHLRGALDDAVDVLEQSMRRLRDRDAMNYHATMAAVLSRVLVSAGRAGEALELVTTAEPEPGSPLAVRTCQLAELTARVALEPDVAPEVLGVVESVAATGFRQVDIEFAFLEARIRLLSGDSDGAERAVHAELEGMVERRLWPSVATAVELLAAAAALDGSDGEAIRLFDSVAALRDEMGAARVEEPPFDLARIEHGARERLAESEREPDGQVLRRDELVAYVRRARGERKRPTFGWRSLTPTEEQVVELVAEGLTNPQIAEKLFVSRSTVKTHLAHVFAKLAVSTRSELAAAAARREA